MKYGAIDFGLIVLLCAAIAGCEVIGVDNQESPQNLRPGPYSFTAYDSAGTALIKGTLRLGRSHDSGWDLKGTWQFEEVQDIEGWTERMIGEGKLRGSMGESGNVRMSLLPSAEDADAVLNGAYKEESILHGEWAIVDWGMTSRSGRFVATPN